MQVQPPYKPFTSRFCKPARSPACGPLRQ